MDEIICINCGEGFESSNEDDLVSRICPDCQDGQTGHHTNW